MGLTSPVVACVWPLQCSLGEGPLWWGGGVWFTDIKQNMVYRFDPSGGAPRSWPAPSQVGFLAPLANGHFIAGTKAGLQDFDPATGGFVMMRAVEPDCPGNRLNDGAVDAQGRLWFGSMDDGEAQPSGNLYRFHRGALSVMDKGYVITNGPAFSPDGRVLYHTDTLARRIYAFDLDQDGGLANKRVFLEIENGGGYPDGPVLDQEGCVWTGLFGGWSVRCYSPQGQLKQTVSFPVANVTKLAFGGPDLKTVYATTARKGLNAAALAAQPLAGALFCFSADTPGQACTAVEAD